MRTASSFRHTDHSDVIEVLARIGYATKGALYLLIGGLATLYAFGSGGGLAGGKEAAQTLEAQPFGQVLLWATAIGLGGYALWRFVQAGLDPEGGARTDKKRIATRFGYALSGGIHAAFAIAVVQMAIGSSTGGGSTQHTYLAKILHMPGGTVLVFVAGIAVIGFGLYQIYEGYRARFMQELKSGEMSATERTWSRRVGRAGLMARGVVSGIIGYFLCQAASSGSSSEAKGVGGALRAVASQDHGTILLAIVALGLVAYALHQFFIARHRRIDAHV
jgi:hypothetical protein